MYFNFQLSTGPLYNGKKSIYLAVSFSRRTYFLQRWDTSRITPRAGAYAIHRGRIMTWTAGTFLPGGAL